ncbi:MAG: hypothetical protein ACE361_14330 [Aureliella sp.]
MRLPFYRVSPSLPQPFHPAAGYDDMSIRGLFRRSALSLFGCILLCWVSNLQAQTKPDTIVTKQTRSSNALKIISYRESGTARHFAVTHVTITDPKGPSPNDRNLVIELYDTPLEEDRVGYAVTKAVQLAEGQTTISVEIPHVAFGGASYWDIKVREGGRDIEDKSKPGRRQVSFQYGDEASAISTRASLQGTNEKFADVQTSFEQIYDIQTAPKTTTTTAVIGNMVAQTNIQTNSHRVIPISSIRPDWRYFYSYFSWTMSYATLEECLSDHPELTAALRDYVAAGGVVVVHGVETEEQLAKLGELVQQTQDLSWSLPGENAQFPEGTDDAYVPVSPEATSKAISDPVKLLTSGKSVTLPYLDGSVVAVPNLEPDTHEKLTVFQFRSAAATTASFDGNWFWRNLIQSAGKPPVWSFAAIVGLLGLILGPGLLLATARIGRRSLMILLVPCVALLSTGLIIGYGILYEGFETHIRVASLTKIDTDNEHGFCWSRQNYFCGLPPSSGLVFDQDTYARPVEPDQSRTYSRDPSRDVNYRILLDEEKQAWRGWIKPRQQQQAFVGHPVESFTSPVQFTRVSGGKLRIQNTSTFPLPFVLAHGKGFGEYFFTKELAAGESVDVDKIVLDEAKAYIQAAMVLRRPESPPEIEDGGSIFSSFGNRSSTRTPSNDVIERGLIEYFSEKLAMGEYTFATLMPENPAVEVPLEGKRDNDFHAVVGATKW